MIFHETSIFLKLFSTITIAQPLKRSGIITSDPSDEHESCYDKQQAVDEVKCLVAGILKTLQDRLLEK